MSNHPLLVLTAPSCAGKDYLLKILFQHHGDKFTNVVSSTTRARRTGEEDGVSYNFVTREKFKEDLKAGVFLESADVYGEMYGTPSDAIERVRASGRFPVKIVEPKGAQSIRDWCAENDTPALFVYLTVEREIALERFLERYLKDYAEAEASAKEDLFLAENDQESKVAQKEAQDSIRKVVDSYTKRIMKSLYHESSWKDALEYDLTFGPMLKPEDSLKAVETIVRTLESEACKVALDPKKGQDQVLEGPGSGSLGGLDEKDMSYVVKRTLLTAMDHAVDAKYLRDLILISEAERRQQCTFNI